MNLQTAFLFAARAHASQLRKDGKPYISHPTRVATLVKASGGDEEQVAAALLHDVIEDCGISRETLAGEFGERVAAIVDWCSERRDGPSSDANWRARKMSYIARLATAPNEALVVALADKVHNSFDLLALAKEIGAKEAFRRLRMGENSQLWYHGQLLSLFEKRLPKHTLTAYYARTIGQLRALADE